MTLEILPNSIKTCDHCNQHTSFLWKDNENWYICPECWSLYHDWLPNYIDRFQTVD
jgi:uncharacterized Zn ribbon protein